MRGGKFIRGAAAGAILAAALGLSGAALAQAVVVSSTGPSKASYPAGKRFKAGDKIVLKAGDQVTILDKAGSRVLSQPREYTIDGTVNRDTTAVAQLGRSLAKPGPVRRAGAVRGPGDPPKAEPLPPSVWLADAGVGGRVCVLEGSDVYLWRDNSDKRRFAWLGEQEGGGMVRLQFPQEVAGVAWPTSMVPLIDGRVYRLTDESNPDNYKDFEIVMLKPESVPVDAAGLGVTLLDNGCRAQFDWLAKSAPLATETDEKTNNSS
jgi:hypothetical protein